MSDFLTQLKAILGSTPLRWNILVQTVPLDLLMLKPLPGEWSALECLQHLTDLERSVFPARAKAILAGQNFPAFDPDRQGSVGSRVESAAALAAEFESLRAESLGLIEEITEADFGKQAVHAELGPVTLGNLLHEWGAHDLMHLVQAEQALMQPFIQGTGPWQIYFTGHIAGSADQA